jgi:hypothetical protein
MNRIFFSFAAVSLAIACGGASSEPGAPEEPTPAPTPAARRDALSFVSPCTASECGEVPSSFDEETTASCAPSGAECAWSAPGGDDTSVSYRSCEPSECAAAEPTADVCPEGLTFGGNTCGSENDAACAWTTACVAPRSTTPCPQGADACGPVPEIGVICADGSTGSLVCVLAGDRCEHQPSCD